MMRTQPHRSQEREGGAAALTLLTFAMITGLAVFIMWVVPLGSAADQKSKNRTAADAAALAGAEFVRNDLKVALASEGWLGSFDSYAPIIGSGGASAQDFARRNGGSLVAYTPPRLSNGWEAYARVESPEVEGERPMSEATARLDFPSCESEEAEPEEPEETAAPVDPEDPNPDEEEAEPDEPPAPPPPPSLELKCDGATFTLDPTEIGGETIYRLGDGVIDQLVGAIDAKLIS